MVKKKWRMRLALGVAYLLIIELILCVLYRFHYGSFFAAHRLFERKFPQLASIYKGVDLCTHFDNLAPHPYLGFVYNIEPECKQVNMNPQGFSGRQHPFEKSQDAFTVMVAGGSVAEQIFNEQNAEHFENYFNQHYISPNGKPFHFISTAMGGYHQPQQIITLLLRYHMIDAFITLDGYNESINYYQEISFEHPSSSFLDFFRRQHRRDLSSLLSQAIIKKVYFSPLSYFYSAYLVSALLYPQASQKEEFDFQETFDSFFVYPEAWGQSKKRLISTQRHKNYVRMMHNIAEGGGLYHAFFIQPVSFVGKKLTEIEKASLKNVFKNEEYLEENRKLYRHIEKSLLDLRADGLPIFSLVDLLNNHPETLYADEVHLNHYPPSHPEDRPSPGHQIMMKRMAQDLEKHWNLKRKR